MKNVFVESTIFEKYRENYLSDDEYRLFQILKSGVMSNRDLFAELSSALVEAKEHSEGKRTLRTHKIDDVSELEISPLEIVGIRERFNLSRGVFAQLLHTSARTLENWEQGRSVPNGQAVTLLKLVQRHPETLAQIAEL